MNDYSILISKATNLPQLEAMIRRSETETIARRTSFLRLVFCWFSFLQGCFKSAITFLYFVFVQNTLRFEFYAFVDNIFFFVFKGLACVRGTFHRLGSQLPSFDGPYSDISKAYLEIKFLICSCQETTPDPTTNSWALIFPHVFFAE